MSLFVFTDGGARGNPGPAAVGVVIKTDEEKVIASFGKYIGETTNNVAEYTAVIEAWRWITSHAEIFSASDPHKKRILNQVQNDGIGISFFLDSKLVVNQLNGLFKTKDNRLRQLMMLVRELEVKINLPVFYSKKNFVYNQIPREKNWQADKLVNEALDSHVPSARTDARK